MSKESEGRVGNWLNGHGIQLDISEPESKTTRKIVYFKNINERYCLRILKDGHDRFTPETEEATLEESVRFAKSAIEDLPDSLFTRSLVAYVAESILNGASRLQETGQELVDFLQPPTE